MTDWLKPFDDVTAVRVPVAAAPARAVPETSPADRAASYARLRAMVMQALGPYAPKAAAPDPEAPLVALLAAHEVAVVEAAAEVGRQRAGRFAAWRMGRELDGHPPT